MVSGDWDVCSGQVNLPAAGSLFIKTHPNSPWLLFDMTLSTDNDKQVCAYAKATGTLDHCFPVAANGKAVHFEFTQDDSEVWFSLSRRQNHAGKKVLRRSHIGLHGVLSKVSCLNGTYLPSM